MPVEVTENEWQEYKAKFNKTYKDEAEDQMRRKRYILAKAKVEEHNKKHAAGEVTWTMALNNLSDLTEEEFELRCGKKITLK